MALGGRGYTNRELFMFIVVGRCRVVAAGLRDGLLCTFVPDLLAASASELDTAFEEYDCGGDNMGPFTGEQRAGVGDLGVRTRLPPRTSDAGRV